MLILTFLVGDFLDGVFDALDFTGGYVSSTAVFSFLSTFGLVGALVLTSGASTWQASLAALGAGAAVGAGAGVLAKSLNDGPTTHQITAKGYIGQAAVVTVPIPAAGMGRSARRSPADRSPSPPGQRIRSGPGRS